MYVYKVIEHTLMILKGINDMLQGTHRASGCIPDATAVQSMQPTSSELAQTCLASWQQHCTQQSKGLAQGYTASLDKPSVSTATGCVPDGQHTRLAGQPVGPVEARQALGASRMMHTKGTPPVRLHALPPCNIPMNIIPRGPKQNLRYWKTIPNGVPGDTERGL